MPYRIRSFFILIILVFAFVLQAGAEIIDDETEVVSLYSKGKRQLREGDYHLAARTFVELEARFPNSKNYDLFIFNRSKARMHLKEYSEAIAGFQFLTGAFGNFIVEQYMAAAYQRLNPGAREIIARIG